jgi:hypothetical protein
MNDPNGEREASGSARGDVWAGLLTKPWRMLDSQLQPSRFTSIAALLRLCLSAVCLPVR